MVMAAVFTAHVLVLQSCFRAKPPRNVDLKQGVVSSLGISEYYGETATPTFHQPVNYPLEEIIQSGRAFGEVDNFP